VCLRPGPVGIGDDDPTMTDLLSRPAASTARTEARAAPPAWLTGVLAGAAMAGAGVLACMGLAVVVWLSGDGGSATAALRAGATAWLLAHGSGVTVAAGTVTAAPLGLSLVVALLAWLAGRWSVRIGGTTDYVKVALTGAAVGGGYTVGVGGAALLASTSDVEVPLLRAVLLGMALSTLAATLGAGRGSGADRAILERLPEEVRAAMYGAAGGVAAFVGLAAATLSVSLVLHGETLQRMLGSLNVSPLGGLLLVLGCILVLPNAVLLTISVILGPGFVLGTGTSVTATAATVGAIPAVPWFAAVPATGSHPAGLVAVMAIPGLCGGVAGMLATRHRSVASYLEACRRGGLAGALAAVVLVVLLAATAASIGPGRMADVGPDLLACLIVAVPAMAGGGVLAAVGFRLAVRP